MATMSAEEKAVRDALAALQADTGIEKANQILGITTPTSSTATSKTSGGISEIDTSTPAGKQAADILNQMQSFVNKTEPDIIAKYNALGYSYNPATGVATPNTGNINNNPVNNQNQISPTFAAGRTLASDTFTNTFALIFGKTEAAQPYVKQLYSLVSGFYTTGSTIEESLNLAIRQAREDKSIPEFTKRFSGLFAIDDKFKAGEAVTVPTIAEFMASEAKLGDVLRDAGLGDLATQEFLGTVLGTGKSVLTSTNIIKDVFNTIDNAPKALKDTLSTYFPGVDRVAIAKAMLTGTAGAEELANKVKGISVLSAAQQQGINVDLATAQDIANQGYGYQESLTGFGQVKNLQRANTIAEFSGGQFTQEQAQQAVFGKSIEQQNALDKLKLGELGRFQGSSGRLASKDRAAGQI